MIDLSDTARDVIELIEATEEKERARAAQIVLNYIVHPKLNCGQFNELLRTIANEITDGE